MKSSFISTWIITWIHLLRWNKPSGRLILLIPAGWSLWLTPSPPPSPQLTLLIILGGISVSAAGCIANDLWDREIDAKVSRTRERPLASGRISIRTAWCLLIFFLLLSFQIIFFLPITFESQILCLKLSLLAIGIILIYPSSKRWFKYPQVLLAICWGFAVLIPWAASQASLNGGVPLLTCWIATMIWTFGFDTIYAMSDRDDDTKLGLKSSAISLGKNVTKTVSICYALTAFLIGIAAFINGIGVMFWPVWFIYSIGMQREIFSIKHGKLNSNAFGKHFRHQVLLGGLVLLGLIIS